MEKFTVLKGLVAPLDRANVDGQRRRRGRRHGLGVEQDLDSREDGLVRLDAEHLRRKEFTHQLPSSRCGEARSTISS